MAKEKEVRFITPEFRVLYEALFEPVENDSGKKKYSVTMGFKKPAEELKALRDAVLAVVKADLPKEYAKFVEAFKKWPNVPETIGGFKHPFLDGDEKRNEINHGYVMIRASSLYQPQVIGRDKAEITDPEAVYSGSYGRASVTIYSYPEIKGGKPGIGIGLRNFQFLKAGDRIAGRGGNADQDFDALPEASDDLDDLE